MSNFLVNPMPAGQASSRFFILCAQILQPAKRHASTYRRTRSRLNVKPDASFLPSKTEAHDHIIYNPPPSMPNVYHTPSIFLPKTDKRRKIQQALSTSSPQSGTQAAMRVSSSGALAPAIREPYVKKYNVTEVEVVEMQALRKEDPLEWTVSKLAKKYNCSTIFVRFVIAGLARDKAAQQRRITEVIKSRWGPQRRTAREDRAIRKDRWLRDA